MYFCRVKKITSNYYIANMNKILLAAAVTAAIGVRAEVIDITEVRYFGPVPVPCTFDAGELTATQLLDCPVSPRPEAFVQRLVSSLNDNDGKNTLNVITFSLENRDFAEATLLIEGFDVREVMLDGQNINGDKISLTPATHKIRIKYVASAGASAPSIKIDTAQDGKIRQVTDDKRLDRKSVV